MKTLELTCFSWIYMAYCPFPKEHNPKFLSQQPRSTLVWLHSLVPPLPAPGHPEGGLLMFPRRLPGSILSSFSCHTLVTLDVLPVRRRFSPKDKQFVRAQKTLRCSKISSNAWAAGRDICLFSDMSHALSNKQRQVECPSLLMARHSSGLWGSWTRQPFILQLAEPTSLWDLFDRRPQTLWGVTKGDFFLKSIWGAAFPSGFVRCTVLSISCMLFASLLWTSFIASQFFCDYHKTLSSTICKAAPRCHWPLC